MKPPRAREEAPLGIFGGTFDPVHFAHLRLAEAAWRELNLSGVLWIPAGQPVLRDSPRANARNRLDMVRLAIADNPRFTLDDAEINARGPSYTVPTLERLRAPTECGETRPLVLLLGADAFAGVSGWYRWKYLFELAHIAIAHRPGCPIDAETLPEPLSRAYNARYRADCASLFEAPAGAIVSFQMTPLDISATRVRQLLANGISARYLIPDPVIDYIERHGCYRAA